MITVKNLTNSPYDLPSAKGNIRLPAFGEVSGEFSGEYLQLLKASRAVEVVAEPVDHDDGGKKGGSKAPAPADDLSRLRTEYHELVGKRPFMGWDAAELQKRIDAALEA